MAAWPKSKRVQVAIAVAAAIFAMICVLLQIATTSFNNFYFGPHKAYPYPYANAHTAQMVLYRDCGLAMLGVFIAVFATQRLLTSRYGG